MITASDVTVGIGLAVGEDHLDPTKARMKTRPLLQVLEAVEQWRNRKVEVRRPRIAKTFE